MFSSTGEALRVLTAMAKQAIAVDLTKDEEGGSVCGDADPDVSVLIQLAPPLQMEHCNTVDEQKTVQVKVEPVTPPSKRRR